MTVRIPKFKMLSRMNKFRVYFSGSFIYYETMRTITLTGMPGSGKTSAAELLAKITGGGLFESDKLIEQKEDCTINKIFAQKGENYFRKLEKNIIFANIKSENQIAALGGGAFEDKEIRNFLLKNTFVVYLKTSPETIYERIKNDKTRPLLNNNMTIKNIEEILNKRAKNYQQAHFTITTDNKTLAEIAKEITGVLS